MWGSTQNLGPIGSVVMTFFGYKHPNRPTKYILYIEDLGKSGVKTSFFLTFQKQA